VVAVLHAPFETDDEELRRPHLTVVPSDQRVTRPCPASAPTPAVYRRRRLVVAVGLVVAVVMAVLVLRAVLAGLGGGSLSTAGSSGAGLAGAGPIPAAAHVHVVQPGDTLWSIAQASARAGDPRPIVDQLQQQLDGRPLRAGERLLVP
jgi:LysM domain